jgi:hypothetical protein
LKGRSDFGEESNEVVVCGDDSNGGGEEKFSRGVCESLLRRFWMGTDIIELKKEEKKGMKRGIDDYWL